MTRLPLISIITITYNAEETLERTILSIIAQNYPAIEYIIIDGASTDGTCEIIRRYNQHITFWMSEPDNGLYDAMNKGLGKASGEYVWFINAGDEVFEPQTLQNIFKESPYADIYYGDTVMTNLQGEVIGSRRLSPPEKLTWKSFRKGMLVSHQSFIAARKLVQPYNLKYRYSADFEWCLVALKNAHNITNTHTTLSRFLDGGITKKNIVPGLKERFRIMIQYYGLLTTLIMHFPIAIKFILFLLRNKRF